MTTLFTAPFLLMGLANFCSIASFASFYLFPLFLLERGASQTDVGFIMGAFSLASLSAGGLLAQARAQPVQISSQN